jgi:hypothetical protein
VSSSYGIDMIALTGMFRMGSTIVVTQEIGPGQAGRVSGGCGDSPWCKVGLMLVILRAVELRRRGGGAIRTVERMLVDDVL